jgi:adenylylsulfate kinase
MSTLPGHVFWIFGLSGAGKSTMATALIGALRSQNVSVLVLDGDELRNGLCRDLGFSDIDRTENLRRAAEVARLGANSGLCVIASFITPLDAHRRLVAEIINGSRLSLVFADAPLEVCRRRDVKGLYAKAQAGQIAQMTGISSSFERPSRTDLTLATSTVTPSASARLLIDFARARLDRVK